MSIASRKNPYRNILLSSISGVNEMVALQPLATAALHAAVSSANGSVVRKIMFPKNAATSGEENPNETNDVALVKDTLQCLCRGLVNVNVTYDGWWKAKFNTVAAHTLVDMHSVAQPTAGGKYVKKC